MKKDTTTQAKYQLKDGKVLKDGHTMFLEDVVQDLQRKSYLEEQSDNETKIIGEQGAFIGRLNEENADLEKQVKSTIDLLTASEGEKEKWKKDHATLTETLLAVHKSDKNVTEQNKKFRERLKATTKQFQVLVQSDALVGVGSRNRAQQEIGLNNLALNKTK